VHGANLRVTTNSVELTPWEEVVLAECSEDLRFGFIESGHSSSVPAPLTFNQQAAWNSLLGRDASREFLHFTIRLRGPLDVEALRASLG